MYDSGLPTRKAILALIDRLTKMRAKYMVTPQRCESQKSEMDKLDAVYLT